MSRFLLSAVALFTLIAPALIMPANAEARSRRCEEEPPETLLSLYRNSSEIHIGKFHRIEDVSIIEETEDYTAVEIKKHFSIRTTLKGEARKFFAAAEQDYRYKTVESEEDVDSPEAVEFSEPKLEPGDDVMIFLKRDEEADSTVLSHYRDAVKKLDTGKMASYEARVQELNAIFATKKVDENEIVSWLVKTAIEEETRWEGAFELLSGYQAGEWREERARYLKEKEEKGEAIEEWERLDAEGEDLHNAARVSYARLLTDTQKEALLRAVTETDQSAAESDDKARKLFEGDRILIELVSRWGDARLAHYLIDQLRNNPDMPYMNAQLMEKVTKVINDERLTELSSRYSNLYYEDTEVVSADDLAAALPIEKSESGDQSEDGELTVPAIDAGATVPPPTMTYGELRAKLLEDFISLSELLLTTAMK